MDKPVQRHIEPMIEKWHEEGKIYVEGEFAHVADVIGHALFGVPDVPEAVRESVKNSCRNLARQGWISRWKFHSEIAELVLQVEACPIHHTRHTTWTPGASCWQGRYKQVNGQIVDNAPIY